MPDPGMPNPGMPDPVLRLEGIRAGYGERDVLCNLDLACAEGELLGVLGANGCGKTTLVRIASGVLAATAGQVKVGGVDVATLPRRELAQSVAVLSQDPGPLFPVSALEVVLLGRHAWQPAFAFEGPEDLDAAKRALDEVEAGHLANRDLTQLSGGERQRVLLARALCQGGRVLLCDEPTAHLDLRHQAAVFRLLRALADRGRAVVVVTHDLNLAAQACDRVALLAPEAGPVIACGRPADVITTDTLRSAFDIAAAVHHDTDGVPHVRRRIHDIPDLPDTDVIDVIDDPEDRNETA